MGVVAGGQFSTGRTTVLKGLLKPKEQTFELKLYVSHKGRSSDRHGDCFDSPLVPAKRTLFEDNFAQKPGYILSVTLNGDALPFGYAKHFSA
jgi:hypothetical protein